MALFFAAYDRLESVGDAARELGCTRSEETWLAGKKD